jgi:hypothetical protein
MASKVKKQTVVLSNGTEIETTKEGWNDEYINKQPVLVAGWGSAPHFSISVGFLVEVAKKQPEMVVGKLDDTPVIDPQKLNQAILELYQTTNGFDVKAIRIATSRATKIPAHLLAVKTAMDNNPAMKAMFLESDPTNYYIMYPEEVEVADEEVGVADEDEEI